MTRVTGGRPAIAEENVQAFFEWRATDIVPADGLAATVFTDRDSAEERHLLEARIALPLLGLPSAEARVLDIGCGAGRWAATLFAEPATAPKLYLGFDFSAKLIELASSQSLGERARFEHASVAEFLQDRCAATGPFSHVLMIAAVMYMNDAAVSSLLRFASSNLTPGGLIYLREGVMTNGQRLTLIEEPSSALGGQYSVIYRTPEEYGAMIHNAGLTVVCSEELSGPHFQRHTDTRHRYFICTSA